jgi:hypothetical protein
MGRGIIMSFEKMRNKCLEVLCDNPFTSYFKYKFPSSRLQVPLQNCYLSQLCLGMGKD